MLTSTCRAQVNEELVKAAGVGAFSGGDVKCKRVKRPKAIKGSSAKTGSAVASACCCGVGGGCKGYDFNVGTHTAKRASVRARKGASEFWLQHNEGIALLEPCAMILPVSSALRRPHDQKPQSKAACRPRLALA